MRKILALDVGTKRVGYAVSDELQTVAFPRGSFLRNPTDAFHARLKTIVREEGVGTIVFGVPLGEDNEETPASQKIRACAEKIARLLMIPIEFVDEFGTTNEALSHIPLRKDRREKGQDDAVAAYLILVRYLEAKKKS